MVKCICSSITIAFLFFMGFGDAEARPYAVLDGEWDGPGIDGTDPRGGSNLYYPARYSANTRRLFNNGWTFRTDGLDPLLANGIGRRGNRSVRFRLFGDATPDEHRSELYVASNTVGNGLVRFGQRSFLGFSLWIGSGSARDSDFVFVQCPQYENARPAFALWLEPRGEGWGWGAALHNDQTGRLARSASTEKEVFVGDDPSDNYTVRPPIPSDRQALDVGRWYDFLIDFQLGRGGHLRVSVAPAGEDLVQVIDWPRVLDPNRPGNRTDIGYVNPKLWLERSVDPITTAATRMKVGMYRPSERGGTQTIYIDEVRHGSSRADANPRHILPISWRLQSTFGHWIRARSGDPTTIRPVFHSATSATHGAARWRFTTTNERYPYYAIRSQENGSDLIARKGRPVETVSGRGSAIDTQWSIEAVDGGAVQLINRGTRSYIRAISGSTAPESESSQIVQRSDGAQGPYTTWTLLPVFETLTPNQLSE